jgi:hypothetical protein
MKRANAPLLGDSEQASDETLKTMILPKMQALNAAIAAANSKRFAAMYDDLTAACNACSCLHGTSLHRRKGS